MEKTQKYEIKDIFLSPVEYCAVKKSDFKAIYPPTEKIPALVVDSFPELGKLAALRFIEWVQANPDGVISLPTGKTPEYFIKWVQHYLNGWDDKDIAEELESLGIDTSVSPNMKRLHFVQIDEFYPIESTQENSFNYYVKKFYIEGFGLDPQKCLLIDTSTIGLSEGQSLNEYWPDQKVDLSLRYRSAKTELEKKQKALLERIDQWCMEYEQKIRSLGGIGFFLGGIGPDGHIGFNIKGSDHYSTNRLCPTNYETQAAAATDLGGIEIARNRLVITIGLKTITYNPECTAVIIAAGAAKATVVAEAIQSPQNINVPATALHSLPNARFYLTHGSADKLIERQYESLKNISQLTDQQAEKILSDLACLKNKPLKELTRQDCLGDKFASHLLENRPEPLPQLINLAYDRLVSKIQSGMNVLENTTFLHTEPHHDDVMLGYFGHVVRHFRRATNSHYFMTLTSGFTSVTNDFLGQQIAILKQFIDTKGFAKLFEQGYFRADQPEDRNRDVWCYLNGVAARSEDIKSQGCARRLLRNIFQLYKADNLAEIKDHIAKLEDYFRSAYPGKLDPPDVQQLKGMCREWEAECLWGYYGWQCQNVRHLRLGFYKGGIFTEDPTHKRDVLPIVSQLKQINPDVITVALDPEASGPDTHYKVLQAIAEALRIYQQDTGRKNITIWGYRNVWYRFKPSEANLFVPMSLCMFSVMDQAFNNAFLSQKNASFPSYEHDGPFSELAQQIQVQQYQRLRTCLGRQWFDNHDSPLIRATRGLIFLKKMQPEEFYQSCRKLKESVES